MSLAPLLAEPWQIPLHAFAALGALALGLWQMLGRKGSTRHRVVGWGWVGLMALVVVSSFFIHTMRQVGPFSWIHGLSLFTAAMLPPAVLAARRGRRTAHARAMTALFALALVLTGAFTLLPGRVMHAVVFGS